MKFSCPLCGGRIEGEEAWIGLQADCPHCAKKITIPAPEVPQPPSSQSGSSEDAVPQSPPASVTPTETAIADIPQKAKTLGERVGEFGGNLDAHAASTLMAKYGAKLLLLGTTLAIIVIMVFMACMKREKAESKEDDAQRMSDIREESIKAKIQNLVNSDAIQAKGKCYREGFSAGELNVIGTLSGKKGAPSPDELRALAEEYARQSFNKSSYYKEEFCRGYAEGYQNKHGRAF